MLEAVRVDNRPMTIRECHVVVSASREFVECGLTPIPSVERCSTVRTESSFTRHHRFPAFLASPVPEDGASWLQSLPGAANSRKRETRRSGRPVPSTAGAPCVEASPMLEPSWQAHASRDPARAGIPPFPSNDVRQPIGLRQQFGDTMHDRTGEAPCRCESSARC